MFDAFCCRVSKDELAAGGLGRFRNKASTGGPWATTAVLNIDLRPEARARRGDNWK